jgi:hypothetical protein
VLNWQVGGQRMTVAAQAGNAAIRTPYRSIRIDHRSIRRVIAQMFSWSRGRSEKTDSANEVDASFRDYLDGYFNSFDYYPVCTRQLFLPNDAYALWSDYMKVAEDFSQSTNRLVQSPRDHLVLEGLTDEEVKAKNDAATQEALEYLVSAFAKK